MSSRSLLFILVFVMLIFGLADGQSDLGGSVSFEQTGVTNERYDAGRVISYNINLYNNGGHTARLNVYLEVGPDEDRSINLTQSREFNLDPRSSGTVEIPVSFMSRDLYKGEFASWVQLKNDTREWDKAWYIVTVVTQRGEMVPIDSNSGKPIMIKVFEEFRNQEISPRMGTSEDLYDYSVEVLSGDNDSIMLKVGPSPGGPWRDLGSREYTTPGIWQTLTWSNNTLDFDFSMAYYTFLGRKQSGIFEGPFWPVVLDFKDNSVEPTSGFSNTPFTYKLMVNSNKEIDVVLNVRDIDSKTYEPAGRLRYSKVSLWDALEWNNVRPSKVAGREGSSYYYFTFHYPGSETFFDSTNEREGIYYSGPDIVLIQFENASVAPVTGSSIVPYTYCVDVNTPLPVCDVELQTSGPGSPVWKTQGIVTYDGLDRRICWSDVNIDSQGSGEAKYRFIRVEATSDEHPGPQVIETNITASVRRHDESFPDEDKFEPYNGSLEDTFIYTVEIPGGLPMVVELEVYDPKSDSWIPAGRQNYDPAVGYLNFIVDMGDLRFTDYFLGETKYRFLSGGSTLGVFDGPNIDVNFKNKIYEDIKDTDYYSYKVDVRSSHSSLPVDLIYTTDGKSWQHTNDARTYSSDYEEWTELVWENKDWYLELDFRAVRG